MGNRKKKDKILCEVENLNIVIFMIIGRVNDLIKFVREKLLGYFIE